MRPRSYRQGCYPKKDDGEPSDDLSPSLEGNPAIDGRLFSDNHPHIANAYPGAKDAVDVFTREQLPIHDDSFGEMRKDTLNAMKIALLELLSKWME